MKVDLTPRLWGQKKWAAFINDTVSFARLSVTPGIRYDKTDTNGDFTSPSLGMTYRATDSTLLRAYTAKGFNIPPLSSTFGDNIFYVANPGLKMEQVWSYEGGVESTVVPHIWMKLSLYRHNIRDVITPEPVTDTTFTNVNAGTERREGMEAELKTTPVFHTSLSTGAAFMNAKDQSTGRTISNVPQRTYDLGLQYDDNSFKALLKGHYIYWNADPMFSGKYDSFLFDIHVGKNLMTNDKQTIEATIDVHNIFNTPQYAIDVYKNPRRWIEAGIRYIF